MKLKAESKSASPIIEYDCYVIDLAANNLPADTRDELLKVLKIGMEIEMFEQPYILRGIELFAVDHLPYGKVAIMVEQKNKSQIYSYIT